MLMTLWSAVPTGGRWILFVALIALVALVVLDLSDNPVVTPFEGFGYLAISAAVLMQLIPAVYKIGSKENPNLTEVCLLSGLIVSVTITAAYFVFYQFFPANLPIGSYERILNLPPVVVAIWAAGMGWYVHYHVSQRNARTKNSFDLAMQTRTSAEFQKNFAAFVRFFPRSHKIPIADKEFFDSAVVMHICNQVSALKGSENPDDKKKLVDLEAKLEKAQAYASLRYILNYYEFMAVGISKRDLDESLLYDTIGPTVVSIYQRAALFINYLNGDGDQCLAYSSLKPLVEKWDERVKTEEVDLKCKRERRSDTK